MSTTDPSTAPPNTPAPSDATRVRRQPDRAAYDEATIHAVLDAGLVGHLGITAADGRPVVIPMLYGRDGGDLYLHGSVASRLARSLASGVDACLTVTLVDGLVLARSAFHHSMNYRSAMVLGRATEVEGEEKVRGLRAISEHLVPGRWDEVREPSVPELRKTSVLRMPIDEASAKARTGGPLDDEDDLALDIWAGVAPVGLQWARPVASGDLRTGIAVSPATVAIPDRPR